VFSCGFVLIIVNTGVTSFCYDAQTTKAIIIVGQIMRQLASADSLVRRFAVMVMLTIAALFFAETASAAPMPSAKELRAALFHSDGSLQEFTAKVPATEFFPDATGYGAIQEQPPLVPVLKGEETLGYVFLNSDYVPSGGYSGKPIHIMIGVDKDFTITKAKLVKHSEPIVLIGIPIEKVNAYIDAYTGRNYPRDGMNQDAPDVISGATVTVMVINETIARSAIAAAKAMQGGGEEGESGFHGFPFGKKRGESDSLKNFQAALFFRAAIMPGSLKISNGISRRIRQQYFLHAWAVSPCTSGGRWSSASGRQGRLPMPDRAVSRGSR